MEQQPGSPSPGHIESIERRVAELTRGQGRLEQRLDKSPGLIQSALVALAVSVAASIGYDIWRDSSDYQLHVSAQCRAAKVYTRYFLWMEFGETTAGRLVVTLTNRGRKSLRDVALRVAVKDGKVAALGWVGEKNEHGEITAEGLTWEGSNLTRVLDIPPGTRIRRVFFIAGGVPTVTVHQADVLRQWVEDPKDADPSVAIPADMMIPPKRFFDLPIVKR